MTSSDFDYLVANHSDYLKPFAISLTHNSEDAKDLFQETMVKALVNREKYQFGTNLKAWLYTIMRNTFINEYRRNKKFVKVQSDLPTETFIENSGKIAVNEGYGHIRMAEIKNAIEQMPQVFRLSFELYYTGYKYQEISELLHEPLGTIKSRIHFARKMLVSQLER
ncbi:MAG: RNA polymerase sigma factor [Bacteroidota bacterium]